MDNDELKAHFDAALAAQTAHFDRQVDELRKKVDPMYTYFMTAETNMKVLKWVAGFLGSVGGVLGAWHIIKEWIKP